jgi:hypothetical protein
MLTLLVPDARSGICQKQHAPDNVNENLLKTDDWEKYSNTNLCCEQKMPTTYWTDCCCIPIAEVASRHT